MAQIIKQPNGLYAIWSGVVDDIIAYDCTREDIIKMRVAEAREDITEKVTQTCAALDAGQKPRHVTEVLTWDEAMKIRKRVHGPDAKPIELDGNPPKPI